MQVFEREFVEKLRCKYAGKSYYITPFIAKLALDPRLTPEKDKIERWFNDVPTRAQPDILGRLQSTQRHQHFGAYYELVVHQFFKAKGYEVTFHPKIEEYEPELLVSGNGLEKPIIIEVATVFDEPSWEREEDKFDLLLEKLVAIEHYFAVFVSSVSEAIPDHIDYVNLVEYVKRQLDSLNSQNCSEPAEFEYKKDNLNLKFTAIPTLEKDSILAAHMLPSRFIGTKQLSSALEKKIQKYKSVAELRLPFIIAVNISNVPAGERGLLNTLFGNVVYRVKKDRNGDLISAEGGRDSSGLFTPKPGLGGKTRNKRVSTVLNVISRWSEHEEDKPLQRNHLFHFIHNPGASVPLSTKLFQGYPQFTVISQDKKGLNLDWIDMEADNPFDC